MSNNTRVLLDQFLEQQKSERTTPLPDDRTFELFACEQVLKHSELSVDELSSGIVGGGNDGGIDGVYTFVNEQLIADDSDIFDSDFSASRLSQWGYPDTPTCSGKAGKLFFRDSYRCRELFHK